VVATARRQLLANLKVEIASVIRNGDSMHV